MDAIQSDDGVSDAASNNGYILGLPFVRAFMIFFDFDKNRIAFANKLNNSGAIITSEREKDAPATQTNADTPLAPEEPVDPNHPEIQPVRPIPVDEEVTPDQDPPINNDFDSSNSRSDIDQWEQHNDGMGPDGRRNGQDGESSDEQDF